MRITGLILMLSAFGALAPFEKNGKWGYRDGSRVVIPARYEAAQEFSPEGLAAIVDHHGWAYIDTAGRVVVRPLVIDNGPDYFSQDLARFRRGGRIGFFNRHGKVVIEPRYAFALPFSEGRAAVCDGCVESRDGEHMTVKGGRWGYIDSSGALAIPLRFEAARPFENGRARVRTGGAWREIGRDGRE